MILSFLFLGLSALQQEQPIDRTWAACEGTSPTTVQKIISGRRALLVGEHHGTTEMPAVLAKIVKTLSRDRSPVVLALEYPEDWQADLTAYLANEPGSPLPFETRDGRTSVAMSQMLRSVKELTDEGADIQIAAVDTWPERGTTPHRPEWLPTDIDLERSQRDIGMGLNAVRACERADCQLLIYYAGNIHTRREPGTGRIRNNSTGEITSYQSAYSGYVIDHYIPAVSLYLSHRGGEAKAISTNGFGMHRWKANTPDYVVQDHLPYCAGYSSYNDYIMSVGTISSSSSQAE